METFSFDGSVTGVDFADFLVGRRLWRLQPVQLAVPGFPNALWRRLWPGSWKVKPNLTLNLGLRWEVSMPWYDTQDKIETIVPGLAIHPVPDCAWDGWCRAIRDSEHPGADAL